MTTAESYRKALRDYYAKLRARNPWVSNLVMGKKDKEKKKRGPGRPPGPTKPGRPRHPARVAMDREIQREQKFEVQTNITEDRAFFLTYLRNAPRHEVETLLRHLSAVRDAVIRRRYGIGFNFVLNLTQIAAADGISREAVRKSEQIALAELREMIENPSISEAEMIRRQHRLVQRIMVRHQPESGSDA